MKNRTETNTHDMHACTIVTLRLHRQNSHENRFDDAKLCKQIVWCAQLKLSVKGENEEKEKQAKQEKNEKKPILYVCVCST